MIYQGDTVRLMVNFKDFYGQPIDPTNITLTIYDDTESQIEQNVLDNTNKQDVGVYFYDYVADKDCIFEFKGTHETNPIVVRDNLKVKFN